MSPASLFTFSARRRAGSPAGAKRNVYEASGMSYVIGVPKEIKVDEYRVAMIPVGVDELTRAGHKVLIQSGAGQGSGISDEQYAGYGAEIVSDAASIWGRADLIVKVKEPLAPEWPL